jgi:SSS family solute:Na+ symporter
MICGGTTTLTLTLLSVKLPFGLDPNIFGITAAALFYVILSILFPGRNNVID